MTRHAESEKHAKIIASRIESVCGKHNPSIGIVLGTGWGDTLALKDMKPVFGVKIDERLKKEMYLKELDFYRLGELEGHARKIALGRVGDKETIALRGRIHLNEKPPSDDDIHMQVRLQVEMLFHLGVKTLILTAAVGSLKPDIAVGDIVAVDGFVTVFAPPIPLFAGEFCSPEDTLDPSLREIASTAARDAGLRLHVGGHAMLRGSFFEGRKYDKPLLAASGASVVGMSILPEACIAALYPDVKVLSLCFVTNSATEEHSHETNHARAKESADKLGDFLERTIANLP